MMHKFYHLWTLVRSTGSPACQQQNNSIGKSKQHVVQERNLASEFTRNCVHAAHEATLRTHLPIEHNTLVPPLHLQ